MMILRIALGLLAALGGVLMLGAAVILLRDQGDTLEQDEVEEHLRDRRGRRSSPALWRRRGYRFRGRATGRAVAMEHSVAELKAALRGGAWWREPYWRLFCAGAGGLFLLVYATFILVLTLIDDRWTATIIGGVLALSIVRMAYDLWRA